MTNHFIATLLIAGSTLGWSASAQKAEDMPPMAAVDSLPASWALQPMFNQTLPMEDAWWKSFNDPVLTELITTGVENNYNVAMALKRIQIAENSWKAAQASLYPTLSAYASWLTEKDSGRTFGTHYTKTPGDNYFSLGLNMNWEIDVFGRVSAKRKADKAALDVSRSDYDATMVSLAANIAKQYIDLRMLQLQLADTENHAETQKKIVAMTEVRHDTGLSSGLDVSQARQVLLKINASIPQLRSGIATAINNLATLTGRYPSQMPEELVTPGSLPEVLDNIAVGIPADLLRRRPDIVGAEMQLAEYAAQIGIAKKDFLPTLSLTAQAGTDSHDITRLFASGSFMWSVAPQLSWTIFDGFSRKYNTADARLNLEAGIDNYNMIVMTAYQEVQSAMTSYSASLESIEAYRNLITQTERTLELSVQLYKQGLSNFTNVMDAQITSLDAKNSLISARADALTSLVTLYQALGGGWSSRN